MTVKPALVPEADHALMRKDIVNRWANGDPEIRGLFAAKSSDELDELIEAQLEEVRSDVMYLAEAEDGTEYQIAVRSLPDDTVHLSIRREDREPLRDWRHLQEIKNALVGEECEGLELFPAESRLLDVANQTHLWCYPDREFRIPVGWDNGRQVSDVEVGKSKQRPRGAGTHRGRNGASRRPEHIEKPEKKTPCRREKQ